MSEEFARAILLAAVRENRCAELLTTLFDGGSVTIDRDGRLVFASAADLDSLFGGDK